MSAKSKKLSLDERTDRPKARLAERSFSDWRVLVAGGLIVAAGLLAYCNSFTGPFIFDDRASIIENPSIRRLWPIGRLISAKRGTTVAGRPVLNLSLAVNYQISALDVWSYHLVNLTVHILAGLVLFGIVRRTLLSKGLAERFGRVSTSLALICALIWLVHPLQTGSVTYIIQRAESLMGLFYLLSLYCAIRGFSSAESRRAGRGWYIGAIAACALGVGTKEVAATVPLMILLYDWIFVGRSFKQIFARRWGLYVGLAGTWVIFGALAWLAPRGETVGFGYPDLSAWVYGITQCKVIVLYYLKPSFWPNSLVFDYGWPLASSFGEVAPYALLLVGLLAGVLVGLFRRSGLGFLGLWFFVILAPSSSFLPIITEVAAEHRMYLPLAAVVVAVVLCGYTLAKGLLGRLVILGQCRAVLGAVLGYTLAGALIVVLGLLSVKRNNDYRTAVSIWDDNIRKCPASRRAYLERGLVYAKLGEYDWAIRDLDQAIKLNPKHAKLYSNRGVVYLCQRKYGLAILDFDRAIELNPKDAKAYNNRGLVYEHRRNYDKAIANYTQAIKLNPKYAKAYTNRGLAYRLQGEHDRAIRDFNKARTLNPHMP